MSEVTIPNTFTNYHLIFGYLLLLLSYNPDIFFLHFSSCPNRQNHATGILLKHIGKLQSDWLTLRDVNFNSRSKINIITTLMTSTVNLLSLRPGCTVVFHEVRSLCLQSPTCLLTSLKSDGYITVRCIQSTLEGNLQPWLQ